MKYKAAFYTIIVLLFILFAAYTYPQVTREEYARAEKFLPWNADKLAFKLKIEPHWINNGEHFWYRNDNRMGKEFVFVDPMQNIQKPAFDHNKLAAALSAAAGETYEHNKLPFDTFKFIDEGRGIQFDIKDARWICDLVTYKCSKKEEYHKPLAEELISPDGRWVAIARNHNLYIRSIETEEEFQLTSDGEPYYDYASLAESQLTKVTDHLKKRKLPTIGLWSPDSKRFLTHKLDQRKVEEIHLLQFSPPEGGRAVHHSYRCPIAGDKEVPYAELVIFDIEQQKKIKLDSEPLIVTWHTPIELDMVWWSKDSQSVYFIFEKRGYKEAQLRIADAQTGKTRTIITEKGSTVVELNPILVARPIVRTLDNTKEIIWFSQRDGWSHIYLYDGNIGQLKNQITSGPWVVRDILHIDEEKRQVYFAAAGREQGRDPYYRHLYRINLDGSNIKLLTPEDAEHDVIFSSSGKYFVDNYSRVNTVPRSVLRSSEGKLIRKLEEADIEPLLQMGWKWPEPFQVKARDGVTDIYGAIFRPSTFDPKKKYPVIDAIYPGPQVIRTPKAFSLDTRQQTQAIAELGFVVVTIDGMGSGLRSKANNDVCYENMGDAGGIEDYIAALKQLAARYPYMDLSRVGIYGHSGGGFASTRAILAYPDFYKVAVSSAGNHDQRGYLAYWGEKYQGLLKGDNYLNQVNALLAENLKGKLLLVCGDMDDNVPPALTLQLVDALIKANKDFDLLVLPNRNHGHATDPYFTRRRWDYFVKNLLGVEPPKEYKIQKEEE
jgi:dipeptidyl aminopeptidase/acylaminoacyl peptidase